MKKKILISNDDGIESEGLWILADGLSNLADIYVIAPKKEMSGSSHSMTLSTPVEVERIGEKTFAVAGTPADCVLLGLFSLLDGKPDLVVSGINLGFNLAEDVFYSGTVAAAREGALYGVKGLSVSIDGGGEEIHFDTALYYARIVVEAILEEEIKASILNLNVPNKPLKKTRGICLARLGTRYYKDPVRKIENNLFKIGGKAVWKPEEGTDLWAVEEGFASLTPLLLDITDHNELQEIRKRKRF